ncbi:hypothetical protein POTOM_026085 [Populus tomentosa]|uniref:Gamma-glutamylcyclotransferase n=1 Tax=Populus tomentosa TaxID=118781 RepID=A0A8X8CZ44_POPTO|nr:hypothetical protein POTOM_026085 [Populus tomentosa]
MVFWVFGYGSLVWNPGFEYDAKVIGFIKDYRLVFLLDLGMFLLLTNLIFCTPACTDHRGTPESPARTCTLEDVEGPVALVVVERGAAFCVRGGPGTERLAMECLERIESDKKSLVDFYKVR